MRAVDERGLRSALLSTAESEVRHALTHAAHALEGPEALAGDARHLVSTWARERAPLALLADLPRRWHALLWDAWLEAVERAPMAQSAQLALVRDVSRLFLQYFTRLTTLLEQAYVAQQHTSRGSLGERRLRVVQQILSGGAVDGSVLSYDLRSDHLAFVASGPGCGDLAQAAERSRTRALIVPVAKGVVWGWVSGAGPDDAFNSTPARVAFGRRARGIEGFRASHRQALAAREVGERRDLSVTHYDDVALEVLAAANADLAHSFVAQELGELADTGVRPARLRATLQAYFACSLNAASTGSLLGVHDQTVTYRLRQIETILGRPIHARRAELEVALRLAAVRAR